MKSLKHVTATSDYYDTRADTYDDFNERDTSAINSLLIQILTKHNVTTVFDMTCGTGSQVFAFAKAGFKVTGSDISPKMLDIAKQKLTSAHENYCTLLQGDCRTIKAGEFDAVVAIFNSIGHLTREDFQITLNNIYSNLKPGGLYIFDIFNLDYLKTNIAKLTTDNTRVLNNEQSIREVQFSTISDDGVLTSYSTYIAQNHHDKTIEISHGYDNTLQVYSATELQNMLESSGFLMLKQTNTDDSSFSQNSSESILTVAQKILINQIN